MTTSSRYPDFSNFRLSVGDHDHVISLPSGFETVGFFRHEVRGTRSKRSDDHNTVHVLSSVESGCLSFGQDFLDK